MDVTEAADGILRIAATAMSYAVKGVTTERGLDAGDFALVAYGGAGPLHAVQVAREIGIRKVIIPHCAGRVLGLRHAVLRPALRLRAHLVHAARRCRRSTTSRRSTRSWKTRAAPPSPRPRSTPSTIVIKRAIDMRYVGQEHAVTVDLPMAVFAKQDRKAIKRHFDDMHVLRYGTSAPDERAEIVSLRSTVTGVMRKPPQEKIARGHERPPRRPSRGKRKVYFAEDGKRAASSIRRPIAAPTCSPATASRAGADRGARLDHRAAAGRHDDGRRLTAIW